MDLGSPPSSIFVVGEVGEPIGFLIGGPLVGGLTDGVRVVVVAEAAAAAAAATEVVLAKNLLRSAMEEVTAEAAGEAEGGVEVLSKVGPTHCRICSTNRCMSILSPHFSQAIRPAGSLGLTCPVNSC